MRQWLFAVGLLLLMPLHAMAQKGLAVWQVMDGRYKENVHTTDVEISSRRLDEYHLTYYHSLTIEADSALMDEAAMAFDADQRNAIDKEISQVGPHIYSGFCMMPTDGSESHYLFFKDMRYAPDGGTPTVTLIYMEGTASMAYLKRRFKKN